VAGSTSPAWHPHGIPHRAAPRDTSAGRYRHRHPERRGPAQGAAGPREGAAREGAGTVPVKRAMRVLGTGRDRSIRLLDTLGLRRVPDDGGCSGRAPRRRRQPRPVPPGWGGVDDGGARRGTSAPRPAGKGRPGGGASVPPGGPVTSPGAGEGTGRVLPAATAPRGRCRPCVRLLPRSALGYGPERRGRGRWLRPGRGRPVLRPARAWATCR
jgi:hypothetical protein